jgi:glycerophosphoryl diester phosphodiesterase
MEERINKEIPSLKRSLSFVMGLLFFGTMTQVYWAVRHRSTDGIILRLILASLISVLAGQSALIFFKDMSKKIKKDSLSEIFVFSLLFFWLMGIGISVSLFLGISYSIYLPIALLSGFIFLFMKHRKYIAAALIIICMAGPLVWYYSQIYRFNSVRIRTLKNLPRNMIWAHRGYKVGSSDNSIESFDAAKKMGYYGIELDIHFIEGKGFVVAHDIPAKEIYNAASLLLDSVFSRYGKQFHYWLDFKNLDLNNAEKSGKLLSKYINLYGLEGRIFVESREARALGKLKSVAPEVNTIYWMHGSLRNSFELFRAKYDTLVSRADTVSLPAHYVSDVVFSNFSHLNIAVFTVNDAAVIAGLFQRGVRIILTDSDMKQKYPSAYRASSEYQK